MSAIIVVMMGMIASYTKDIKTNEALRWLSFKDIFGHLKTINTFKVNMPIWGLLILSLAIVFFIFKYFQLLNNRIKITDATSTRILQEKSPEFLEYTDDTFGELFYRWEWGKYDNKYKPYRIKSFCPKDKNCQLLDGRCSVCGKVYLSRYTNERIRVLINNNIDDKHQIFLSRV